MLFCFSNWDAKTQRWWWWCCILHLPPACDLSLCGLLHMQAAGTATGSFAGLLVASVLLHSHCDKPAIYFLITLTLIYHALKKWLITPRIRRVICLINTQLKPETTDGRKVDLDDLRVRMSTWLEVFKAWFCFPINVDVNVNFYTHILISFVAENNFVACCCSIKTSGDYFSGLWFSVSLIVKG